jgi:hypothetical protein
MVGLSAFERPSDRPQPKTINITKTVSRPPSHRCCPCARLNEAAHEGGLLPLACLQRVQRAQRLDELLPPRSRWLPAKVAERMERWAIPTPTRTFQRGLGVIADDAREKDTRLRAAVEDLPTIGPTHPIPSARWKRMKRQINPIQIQSIYAGDIPR